LAFWLTENMWLKKHRVHRASRATSAGRKALCQCAPGHVTPDYTPIAVFFKAVPFRTR